MRPMHPDVGGCWQPIHILCNNKPRGREHCRFDTAMLDQLLSGRADIEAKGNYNVTVTWELMISFFEGGCGVQPGRSALSQIVRRSARVRGFMGRSARSRGVQPDVSWWLGLVRYVVMHSGYRSVYGSHLRHSRQDALVMCLQHWRR